MGHLGERFYNLEKPPRKMAVLKDTNLIQFYFNKTVLIKVVY